MTLRTSKKTIMHPYMNADLTFADLREMILHGMNGKLEVSEKIDGMNYRFKITERLHSLGGGKFYSIDEYSEKVQFDDNVLRVMKSIEDGCDENSFRLRYSGYHIECELILQSSANVVEYPFKTPTLVIRRVIDSMGQDDSIDEFISHCNNSWIDLENPEPILHSARVGYDEEREYARMVSYSDSTLSRCLHRKNLTSNSTIGDYLYACALEVVRKEFGYSLSNSTEDLLCRRWALNDRSIRLSGKSVGKRFLDKVKEMDKVVRKFQDEWFFDLYVMISKVGNYIISRYVGYINDGNSSALGDMNTRLNRLIVDTSSDYKKAFASRVISNSGMDSLSKSTEGVVFKFKGEDYKFVGNFTWINQLLWANKIR
jgi:hypothetical protein